MATEHDVITAIRIRGTQKSFPLSVNENRESPKGKPNFTIEDSSTFSRAIANNLMQVFYFQWKSLTGMSRRNGNTTIYRDKSSRKKSAIKVN